MENLQDEESEMERENWRRSRSSSNKVKEGGVSCMLSTEISNVMALIRRAPGSPKVYRPSSDDHIECSLLLRFKSLRTFIFDPQQEWRSINPSVYMSPFLQVIKSYNVPAAATGIALSSVLKILNLDIFDHNTPGAGDAMNSIVNALSGCTVEQIDEMTYDAVKVRILYLLVAILKHKAHVTLTDQSVCSVVHTCLQIVQSSTNRGNLVQRNAGHTMVFLIHLIYGRVPKIEIDGQSSKTEDTNLASVLGLSAAVDIFQFLCSLLKGMPIESDIDGSSFSSSSSDSGAHLADLDVQMFALILINTAIELSGENMSRHPKLLRLVQDDLFYHLIRYGRHCHAHVFSMVCSTVLNIYHFLRRSVRLQLEAFISHVLFRAAMSINQYIQEIAIEAIVNFFRQPTFTIEMYGNYDCSLFCPNVFEETAKLICKNAFPVGGVLNTIQLQSFEGLAVMIHTIAENVDKEDDDSSSEPYPVEITPGTPFWEEISKDVVGLEKWISVLRINKVQKKRMLIAGNHFNQEYKKGFEYVKLCGLISASDPPDPKAYAAIFRYTPGLDKTLIGEYLGEPDEFNLQVLREYTDTFEFFGILLDSALRFYLETFRLPGESQKIHRVMEAFADRFYDQERSGMFANRDAVFVLGYSIIMLNTDLHSKQVKKKMSVEDFIKNNRSINGDEDLPREYLTEIYHSIASKPLGIFDDPGLVSDMMIPYRWTHLVNRSKVMNPYVVCDFDRRLWRDMFAAIAGPSIATVAAIFEHSDDENVIHECVEALFSIARIAQYQLLDTLDELICVFCKFTTLLNPYASTDETLFAFSNDMKPRIATLAVFNIANTFKDFLRGSWRNIVDCLLKLRKLKLLPPSVFDPDTSDWSCWDYTGSGKVSHSNTMDDSEESGKNGLVGRFQDLVVSTESSSVEESLSLSLNLNLGGVNNEFEQNVQIIQQCHIERIFRESSGLPEESLYNLGRYLILAAGGKGQKFSTPVEEEEAVALCWDLIATIAYANTHRFSSFWPQYHEYLLVVSHFPLFSPIPFAEKAIVAQVKIALKLLSMTHPDRTAEELIFKSVNLMSKLEKEILDTCSDFLLNSITKIITEYGGKVQSNSGWKSILHLLSATGRHPDSYDQGVEAIIRLLSHKSHLSRANYVACLECAFSFIALKNSPVDKNMKLMDLMCESVKLLAQWHRNGSVDPDMNAAATTTSSSSSIEENHKGGGSGSGSGNRSSGSGSSISIIMYMFQKIGDVFRNICLSRREEVRNYAVRSIHNIINSGEELWFTPTNSIFCFKKIVFPMVEDVCDKMLEYAARGNAERESISMENTLKIAIGVMTEVVYVQLLKNQVSENQNPQLRQTWARFLRRMENHMKTAGVGVGKETLELISNLIKKIVGSKETLLVAATAREEDDA